MREIKFKAWDKKNKQIAEVVAIDYLANEVMLDYSGKMYFLNFEYAELLQFTGLKDKNGMEIYEGDILFNGYYEEHGKVVFEEGTYVAEYDTWQHCLCESYRDSEVTGNIYESPEIME